MAKKPTALAVIEGNPGKRKLNHNEPVPNGGPQAPPSLSDEGRKVWAETVGSMPRGVYTSADSALIAVWCEAVANHRNATRQITEHGYLAENKRGQDSLSQWHRIQNEAARLMVAVGPQLGLSPTARSNLSLPFESRNKFLD